MRISAPPINHPCHYGIDMSTREEMIAHGRTTDEIAAELGCDSLAYLSMEGVYEAIGASRATPLRRVLHRRLPARGTRRGDGSTRSSSRSCAPSRGGSARGNVLAGHRVLRAPVDALRLPGAGSHPVRPGRAASGPLAAHAGSTAATALEAARIAPPSKGVTSRGGYARDGALREDALARARRSG